MAQQYSMLLIRMPVELRAQLDSFVASQNEARDPLAPPYSMNAVVCGAVANIIAPDGGAPVANGHSARKPAKKGKRK